MGNMPPMNGQQQLQYQQLLARQGQFYPQMNGFQPPLPGMDAYRSAPPSAAPGFNGSPMMQPANLAGPGMVPGMGYPYGMYMPQQQQQQQQQAAGGAQRRGRVSRNASPAPGGRR
jgi:protein JSN1